MAKPIGIGDIEDQILKMTERLYEHIKGNGSSVLLKKKSARCLKKIRLIQREA